MPCSLFVNLVTQHFFPIRLKTLGNDIYLLSRTLLKLMFSCETTGMTSSLRLFSFVQSYLLISSFCKRIQWKILQCNCWSQDLFIESYAISYILLLRLLSQTISSLSWKTGQLLKNNDSFNGLKLSSVQISWGVKCLLSKLYSECNH